jgi:putative oxidoreductase
MRNIGTWILSSLLALAFLAAGFMKLTSRPMEVQLFTAFGLPIWTMYAVAVFEIVCAIGLLFPRYAAIAALLLVCDMLGALFMHITHGQIAMALAPLVLGLLAATIVMLRGGVEQIRRTRLA